MLRTCGDYVEDKLILAQRSINFLSTSSPTNTSVPAPKWEEIKYIYSKTSSPVTGQVAVGIVLPLGKPSRLLMGR